jgi:phosphohistidine swiveling domain-containing protein
MEVRLSSDEGAGSPTVLHHRTRPDWYWTTTNASEAIPGVLTPLSWTLWGPCGEKTMRRVFHTIGGLPRSALALPADERDRMISIFYGRIAINVDTFVRIGNAMPGVQGIDLARQMLGYMPDELLTDSAWRRYPLVLWKFPPTFLRMPAMVKRLSTVTDTWYRATINEVAHLDLSAARRVFRDARHHFDEAVYVQTLTTTTGIQPIFQQLTALAERAGVEPDTLMVGHGSHVESQLVQDLWDCSRERGELDEVVASYGYHGPGEGQVSGTVWRQDRGPLERVLTTYRDMPDDKDPRSESQCNTAARRSAESELLASLSPTRRPAARLILRLAERYLPLRGACKVAFLQSLDVCRATSVRIGELLSGAGVLAVPDDIFYWTCDELLSEIPVAVDSVAARRSEYESYLGTELPVSWRGDPTPIVPTRGERAAKFNGVGVSRGQVTGPARIILDPTEVDMRVGDVLVARTTDPSWASMMYPAAALVVEIGGQLSHAAVVARELGIPCVMGIPDVTRGLRDGDLVRVDGTAGRVEVIEASGDVA